MLKDADVPVFCVFRRRFELNEYRGMSSLCASTKLMNSNVTLSFKLHKYSASSGSSMKWWRTFYCRRCRAGPFLSNEALKRQNDEAGAHHSCGSFSFCLNVTAVCELPAAAPDDFIWLHLPPHTPAQHTPWLNTHTQTHKHWTHCRLRNDSTLQHTWHTGHTDTHSNTHLHTHHPIYSICLHTQQHTHTHTHTTVHTTVAERITQQITDPVNYMWPVPEVRGHSW